MARRTVFLDTSYVVALERRNDPHHERAKKLDGELLRSGALCVLHWGVMMEVADGYARADRRPKALALLDRFATEDRYHIAPITAQLWEQALTRMALTFAVKP